MTKFQPLFPMIQFLRHFLVPPPYLSLGEEGSLGRDRKRYRYFTLHGILNTTGVWEWGGG